jgi:Domain of unknown function (DUF6471)
MRQSELTWPKLASRLMRVAMVRADTSYSQLAAAFLENGEDETVRSIETRVFRGKAPFGFFLAILGATQSDIPPLWREAMAEGQSWDEKAAGVLKAELANYHRVSATELSRRMESFGRHLSAQDLEEAVKTGAFSVIDFLKIAAALGLTTLERYVDLPDLDATALSTFPDASE